MFSQKYIVFALAIATLQSVSIMAADTTEPKGIQVETMTAAPKENKTQTLSTSNLNNSNIACVMHVICNDQHRFGALVHGRVRYGLQLKESVSEVSEQASNFGKQHGGVKSAHFTFITPGEWQFNVPGVKYGREFVATKQFEKHYIKKTYPEGAKHFDKDVVQYFVQPFLENRAGSHFMNHACTFQYSGNWSSIKVDSDFTSQQDIY